jgi:hypothetical protein
MVCPLNRVNIPPLRAPLSRKPLGAKPGIAAGLLAQHRGSAEHPVNAFASQRWQAAT